jgi:hypothetical protein
VTVPTVRRRDLIHGTADGGLNGRTRVHGRKTPTDLFCPTGDAITRDEYHRIMEAREKKEEES